jgi:hypothetical protein
MGMKKSQKGLLFGLAAAGVVMAMRTLIQRRQNARLNPYASHTDWEYPHRQSQPRQEAQRENVSQMETRYQGQDQPDRQPIPQTGAGMSEAAYLAEELVNPVPIEEITAEMVPLFVQHLLAFSEMMKLLRYRRETETLSERSLTPDDRGRVMTVLEKLDDSLTKYSDGSLENGSLPERMYRLTLKMRDAMENLSYDDADLFRLNGEVRPEACRLIREVRQAGDVAEETLAEVSEEYRCV